MCVCECMYVYMYVCVHVCMCTCMYVYMYVCIHVCETCVCIHVCVSVYICVLYLMKLSFMNSTNQYNEKTIPYLVVVLVHTDIVFCT